MEKISLEVDVLIYQMVAECNKFKCNLEKPGFDFYVIPWKRGGFFLGKEKIIEFFCVYGGGKGEDR